jgi:hypothetical protein
VVAALASGRTSWTAVLDAIRLGPADDATAVTAAQLRETVDRLRQAGHWRAGDPDIWIVLDSGLLSVALNEDVRVVAAAGVGDG